MTIRRWAPAGAAAAVVAIVAAVALVLGGDDFEPGGVATLPAPIATASASASPSDAARPSPPEDVPAAPPSAAPRPAPPAPAAPDPDTPVSSDDEPSPAPASPKRTTAPAPPPTTPAPKPSPGAARSSFAFDAAYGTDEPYEVVVQYGDSSSCPHANVRHTVRESVDRIVVTLEADAMDPARACTADYRQRLVPVRLQQPLGDRVLVDGSRDEQVAVDRACNRPFADPPPPKDCTP